MEISNGVKGQSLIELLVAIGVFVTVVSAVGLLLIRTYISAPQAIQYSQAVFLAQEGMEAVRSIRNNNWEDLIEGPHGLAVFNNHWVFQGSEEDVSSQLPQGKRKITVENLTPDKKRIVSQVIWESPWQAQDKTELITFLTNWQKIGVAAEGYCEGTPEPCSSFPKQGACRKQDGCLWQGNYCSGTAVPCENYPAEKECLKQEGCQWVLP